MASESEKAAARLVVVGFGGDQIPASLRGLLELGVSGVVLFAKNIPDPGKIRELTGALKASRVQKLLLCVDQEGGRVARLRGEFTPVPSMRMIGAAKTAEDLAHHAGVVLGAETRWAGFDVDFAPVVDVDSNPANPVIADRSFGADVNQVCALAARLIPAMQSRGVAACAKHFPGHGDTAQDSHHDLPRLAHDLARLERVELPPFRAAIGAGVASVMSAHVVFEPLDARFPATMSPPALGGILRDRFKFDGVVFSDDLEMKALANHFPLEEQLLRGSAAGLDLFTICHSEELQRSAISILAGAIDRGLIPAERVKNSLRRIDSLTARFAGGVGTGTLADVQASVRPSIDALKSVGAYAPTKDPTKFK